MSKDSSYFVVPVQSVAHSEAADKLSSASRRAITSEQKLTIDLRRIDFQHQQNSEWWNPKPRRYEISHGMNDTEEFQDADGATAPYQMVGFCGDASVFGAVA
jgi:hypothetical protein